MTLESILSHGARRLPDHSLRLQLLVFNSVLLLSGLLTLGLGLVFLGLGDYEPLVHSVLPFLALFFLIYLFARQRYFLLARILYIGLALIAVAFGVHRHGTQSHLSLYCLDLALLPFLLFRTRECRWMVTSSALAFVLFVLIEFDLVLVRPQSLTDLHPYARILLSVGAFIGVLAPSLLVFWQNHLGFRRTLRINRVRARAEKFAAIGRLAAGAAHEINNPLAIVQLTLENLESSGKVMTEPLLQSRMRHGYEAIQRIHQIVQKLLASTLLPPSPLESWLVSEVAQLIGQRCQRYLKAQGIHLSIRMHVLPDCRLLCHQESMLDVVDSLINNTLDAMIGHRRPRVVLTLACENSHFVMKLEDNGPGVSEQHLRSIFTPFFTTKDVGSGLGLSLYSARCLAQQYGGDLTCEHGPGGRFYLSLPLEQDSSSRQA